MLVNDSVSDYKFLNIGGIKVAFSVVCKDGLFQDVYFSANALYYVQSGKAVLMSDHEQIVVRPGEVALITQHSKLAIQKLKATETDANFTSIILYLLPEVVFEFLRKTKIPPLQTDYSQNHIIALGEQRSFQTFAASLLPLFHQSPTNSAFLKAKTVEALQALSHRSNDFLHVLSQHAKPVKIDLYEFMIQTTLSTYSVNELAQLTGRSLSAFKRDFHQVFNTSPHQWLLNQKIDYAEKLLRESNMKPSEFYHFLGFNELSHFSAAFKKRKGMAPTRI